VNLLVLVLSPNAVGTTGMLRAFGPILLSEESHGVVQIRF
jgi:hypothetical protein